MFNHRHYVPVLKWKQGEYQALHRLNAGVKDNITPILEIPSIGFDHESGTARESIDSHLGDFGRRLKAKWNTRLCFVDLKYISPATRMADGSHYVEALFSFARAEGCRAIPVIALDSDPAYTAAVGNVVRADGRGVCVRLVLADFDRPNFQADVARVLAATGVGYAEADLIVDFAAPTFEPVTAFTRTTMALLGMVPMLNRWRTFTIAGTSYPSSIASVAKPFGLLPRQEWNAYRSLVTQIGATMRIPTFGDYAVAHPDPLDLDMRLIKPFAKLRYTIDGHWHIGRGDTVRTHGFGQFQRLCADLVAQPYFSGASYSAADAYIAGCAAGTSPTGNLTTWVWVATNRHLTKVVGDLASFHGLSVAAE